MISFKGKKIIVFDLDGTVVRLAADWPSLKNELCNLYAQLYNDGCDFASISACLSKIIEREDWVELDNFFDIIRTYEMKNITQNNPIKETIFFIKHKEKFGVDTSAKMAIFSLNTRKTIETSLSLARITEFIHFYVGREDVRHWKPEPEGLLKIKKHFNVSEEKMIYFGDLEKDLLAGKNAGVESYYIEDLLALVKKVSDVV